VVAISGADHFACNERCRRQGSNIFLEPGTQTVVYYVIEVTPIRNRPLKRLRRCEKMLLIIAVLALLSAAFLLFRFAKRPDPELSEPHYSTFEPSAHARPLFAPSDAELKLESDAEAARAIARREHLARAASRASVDAALEAWRAAPAAGNTAELLRVTAESGLEGDFERAAREVINKFRKAGINGLSDHDLAALIDSHIRLLSAEERASGAIFWLKQEAAKFRPGSVSDQL
jgi:hypothetical protein